MLTLVTIIALLLGLGLFYISLRNALVAVSERANSAWTCIDFQLKRRHDLIPALVKAVRSAKDHDTAIIEKIVNAREAAVKALAQGRASEISGAEAELTRGIQNYISYAESNPQVTATANLLTFQNQIEDTEDQIAAARRFYNAAVEAYNTCVRSLPHNLVASHMGLLPRAMIEFSPAELAQISVMPEINV